MAWTPADLIHQAGMAAGSHYGYLDGFRTLRLRTQHESPEWRARAAEHETARQRLNGLLPPPAYLRSRHAGATFISDHRSFDSAAVQEALSDYRLACAEALLAPRPKPRRILDMIRLAAEVAGAPDPVWSAADWGGGLSRTDIAFNKLFRQTERALRAGGLL